ncbi:MAG: hypothetical protein AAB738_03070 [Patescibacteria group bacterium]
MPKKITILIIAVAVIVGGTYYLIHKNSQSREAARKLELGVSLPSENGLKTYRNDGLGIEFKYPASWPDLTIRRQSEDQSLASYRGTQISASCSSPNCAFNLLAYTPDYVFMGMDSGGEISYLGLDIESRRLVCSYYSLAKDCKSFEIQGRKAVVAYQDYAVAGVSHRVSKIFLIENSNHKFAGIVLEAKLHSLDRQSAVNKTENAAYAKYAKEKLSRNDLSAEDKNMLKSFGGIVSSLKFLN